MQPFDYRMKKKSFHLSRTNCSGMSCTPSYRACVRSSADKPYSKQNSDLANCSCWYCGWELLAWTGYSALAIQTIIWVLIFHELNNSAVEWEALTVSWNGEQRLGGHSTVNQAWWFSSVRVAIHRDAAQLKSSSHCVPWSISITSFNPLIVPGNWDSFMHKGRG